jgi:hypothetical protein
MSIAMELLNSPYGGSWEPGSTLVRRSFEEYYYLNLAFGIIIEELFPGRFGSLGGSINIDWCTITTDKIGGLGFSFNVKNKYEYYFAYNKTFGLSHLAFFGPYSEPVNKNAGGGGGNGIDGDDIWVGATGTYLSTVGNVSHNRWWWQDASGSYRSIKLLNAGANGKYVQGVQGLRNGYAAAGRAASLTKIAGNTLGAIGVGISVYDMTQNGINVSNSMDAIMGATTFIPVFGWIVSGTYFTASFVTELTTGKSISEHAQGWVNNW